MKKNNKLVKILFTMPIILYAFVLIFLPILYVLFLSFFKSDSYGGIVYNFTLQNYLAIFDITYIKILVKSSFIALVTTLVCICIAYPFCLFVVEKDEWVSNIMMKMVMVPFLTNSLIRTYGWIVLLRKNGVINNFLVNFSLISNPLELMYNNLGIIIGMVYTLLPFMILPLYSSVAKLDRKLIEAGMDLGANRWQIFWKIIIAQTIPGVFNGSLMVFIPATSYFFISDILGGGKVMIIGNLIKNQFLTARNWPFGSAIAIFLIIVTLGLVEIYKKLGGKMDDLGGF